MGNVCPKIPFSAVLITINDKKLMEMSKLTLLINPIFYYLFYFSV